MDELLHQGSRKLQMQSSIHRSISVLNKGMLKRIDLDLSEHDMTYLQWLALSGIEIEGYHAPSTLAVHLGISRPALSRLIKKLVGVELVERGLVSSDGRGRNLQATELGRNKVDLCWPLIVAHQEFYVRKLSDYQRKAFEESVQLLSAAGETSS